MSEARKLTEVERAQILDLVKQSLSQRAIAIKVNRIKIVFCKFLKYLRITEKKNLLEGLK